MPVITTARTERPRPARYADRAATAGVAAVSAALLMTELALTRIFSVTMYYHFAFLAISIALFGLSASGVAVYLLRRRLAAIDTRVLLAVVSTAHAFATLAALACLVRIRVGLNYSAENLGLMLAIYTLAALPFFTGGGTPDDLIYRAGSSGTFDLADTTSLDSGIVILTYRRPAG